MVPDQNKIDKDANDQLDEFVKRVQEAAGPNLESIVLFGSAVSGDFHPGLSNLNLFCVLRDSSFAALQALASGREVVGSPEAAAAALHDPARTRALHRRFHHRTAGHAAASPRSVWRRCRTRVTNFDARPPRAGGIRTAGKTDPAAPADTSGRWEATRGCGICCCIPSLRSSRFFATP